MRHNIKLFAAIDIGSHELIMKLVQIDDDKKVNDIETVRKIVPLGRDTFNNQKVSFESVGKTCKSIKGFKRLMSDYGVKSYKVVATSAIREAQNKEYILDQIKLKTGFDVEIINNSEEKFLSFLAIKDIIQKDKNKFSDKTIIILDIGAGSIQTSIIQNNLLTSSQSIKLGALRIKEILSNLEKRTLNFKKVIEEYIEAHVENMDYFTLGGNIDNFIVIGGGMEHIAKICGVEKQNKKYAVITKKRFEDIYEKFSNISVNEIVKDYNLFLGDAEIIVPSLILVKKFFDRAQINEILIPKVCLVDGIILEYVNGKKIFYEDIINYVIRLAEKYQYNKLHSHYVEKIALEIFNKCKSLHGLSKREMYLLQIAAILHDTGKFIGLEPHYKYSYDLIRASTLPGLSDNDVDIISAVARYHSTDEPNSSSKGLNYLSSADRVLASKLIAIIRLADALDTSHKQKISNISISVSKDYLRIKGEALTETLLEQWTFDLKADFFEEVFGVKPTLKIKNAITKR